MHDGGIRGFSTRRSPAHWALAGVVVLVLGGSAYISFDRAARQKFDFHHFYLDAAYVWTHGALNPLIVEPSTPESRQLPFYLPVVSLAIAPLGALELRTAAAAWAALQVLSLAYCLWALYRWCAAGRSPERAAATMLIALVVSLPVIYEATKFNQLSYFVLGLLLAGFTSLDRGLRLRAGAFLAAAAVLKLLPALLLVWFILKREWTALIAFVFVTAFLTIAPPWIAFGPERAAEYHRQWWRHNIAGAPAEGMLDPKLAAHLIDRRNQSFGAVFSRLFWKEHPYRFVWQPASLSREACAGLARFAALIAAFGLFWFTRRPWRGLDERQRRGEFAMYLIALQVLSPLVRMYYLVWTLPALVLLTREAANATPSPERGACRIAFWIWTGGMIAWMWQPLREAGLHLAMLLILGGLLLRCLRAPRMADSA